MFKDYVEAVFSGKKGVWTYVYEEDIVGVTSMEGMKTMATFLGAAEPIDIRKQ